MLKSEHRNISTKSCNVKCESMSSGIPLSFVVVVVVV